MKWTLLFCVFLSLLAFSIYKVHSEDYSHLLSYGSGFNFYYETGGKLAFQGDAIILFTVASGTLNGTGGSYQLNTGDGSLAFVSQDTATLNAYFPSSEQGAYVESDYGIVKTGDFNYTLTVPSGVTFHIDWGVMPRHFIDMYFWTGAFCGGVGLMVASPCWAVWKIRKEGLLETDTMERIGYAMLLFLVGLGLVITYLWR